MKLFFIAILCLIFSCTVKKPQNNLTKHEISDSLSFVMHDADGDGIQEDEVVYKKESRLEKLEVPKQISPKSHLNKSKSEKNSKIKNKQYKNDDKITIGKLVYKIPDTMIVKKTYNLRIRIIRDTLNEFIYRELPNSVEYTIKTTEVMETKIVDPSPDSDKNFEIVKSNKDIQSVDKVEYTEWVYDVTPLKSGKLKLNIVVSIINGGSIKEVVYFDTIYVRSNPKKTISDFGKENWKWLISTIIIPLIVWLFNRKDKKNT